MPDRGKPTIKIGHIKITDHLILGVTKHKAENGEPLQYSNLETECKMGWNEVDYALCKGDIDGAFLLAPMALDLFKSGQKIKLVLFGHKNGSTLIKNNRTEINEVKDFKGKTIIIPYQLSIHHMLLHKMLAENGLTIGIGNDVLLEVFAPFQIPEAIQYDEIGEIEANLLLAERFDGLLGRPGVLENELPDLACRVDQRALAGERILEDDFPKRHIINIVEVAPRVEINQPWKPKSFAYALPGLLIQTS